MTEYLSEMFQKRKRIVCDKLVLKMAPINAGEPSFQVGRKKQKCLSCAKVSDAFWPAGRIVKRIEETTQAAFLPATLFKR